MKKPTALTLYDVIRGDAEHKKRLRFALSLSTMDQKLKQAIEDERDQRELDAEAEEAKHAVNSRKGGALSVQVRRSKLTGRNREIVDKARKLMAPPSNYAPYDVCGVIAKDVIAQGLSTKQIRTILQDEGVLEKRRK